MSGDVLAESTVKEQSRHSPVFHDFGVPKGFMETVAVPSFGSSKEKPGGRDFDISRFDTVDLSHD